MSGTTAEVMRAAIEATDNASRVIEEIRLKFMALGHTAEKAGQEGEHGIHRIGHAFDSLSGHINLIHTRFGNVRAGIGEIGSGITELIPALAGLGAAGGVAGMFELTESVAHAEAEMTHAAQAIGMTTQQMQRLSYAARMSDTDVGRVQTAMFRLNRVIGEGAKNKDATALFARMGIATRDAQGNLLSAEQILPRVATAFQNTASAAMRSRMAFALFGRAGMDMLPMLQQGGEHIAELFAESGKIGYIFSDDDKRNLQEYDDSIKKLKASVGGFSDELGAKLAPALQPVLDMAQRWVVANRDWIATSIADKVKQLGTWLSAIDWDGVITAMSRWTHDVDSTVQSLGGLRDILGAVDIAASIMFAAKVGELVKSVGELHAVTSGPILKSIGTFWKALAAGEGVMGALDAVIAANPIGLIVLGVAAATGAVILLWQNWDRVTKAVQEAFAWMGRVHDAFDRGIAGTWIGRQLGIKAQVEHAAQSGAQSATPAVTPARTAMNAMIEKTREAYGLGGTYHETNGAGAAGVHGGAGSPSGPAVAMPSPFAKVQPSGALGNISRTNPPPAPSAQGTAPPAPQMTVIVNNAPPGTTVTTITKGGAPKPKIATGQAWPAYAN